MKMRVKAVPRQRVLRCSKCVDSQLVPEMVIGKDEESEQSSSSYDEEETSKDEKDALHGLKKSTADLNMNHLKDESVKEEKEEEVLNYSEQALDLSIASKIEIPGDDSTLLTLIAGPSCQCTDSHSDEDTEDSSNDDNNNLQSQKFEPDDCPTASASSKEESSDNDEDILEEAVNLCKRDCCEEYLSNASGGSDERLKDTFLYKIMTDPTFLENIQKHKQLKGYMCQFCKQKFNNSDELADHMLVKKNESNQVVCCACKKTFTQKRYLRYHQRCHSERAMFTCDICTKKYTRMDNLSRHIACHVNPDKFSCTCCEKTFARKDMLNKHLKCHDNKHRFYCEACQKYFKGQLTLDNHKRNFHSVA